MVVMQAMVAHLHVRLHSQVESQVVPEAHTV